MKIIYGLHLLFVGLVMSLLACTDGNEMKVNTDESMEAGMNVLKIQ